MNAALTHAQLVERAAKWLLGTVACRVVLTEKLGMACCGEYLSEMPDAIGWTRHKSILVECKTSRADMLSDRKKAVRRRGGAGDVRYVLCERGILLPSDILPGWGLLWVCGQIVRCQQRPQPIDACAKGLRRERYMLTAHIAALARKDGE